MMTAARRPKRTRRTMISARPEPRARPRQPISRSVAETAIVAETALPVQYFWAGFC